MFLLQAVITTLRSRQNGRQFPDYNFECIFLDEYVYIWIKILLTSVSNGPIGNSPALVHIMTWCRTMSLRGSSFKRQGIILSLTGFSRSDKNASPNFSGTICYTLQVWLVAGSRVCELWFTLQYVVIVCANFFFVTLDLNFTVNRTKQILHCIDTAWTPMARLTKTWDLITRISKFIKNFNTVKYIFLRCTGS